jgi:hydroxymethylbilane synthase
MRPLRLGSRGSVLALRQCQLVEDALRRLHPAVQLRVVIIRAKGDEDARPAWRTDAPGLFTNSLTRALLAGEVDAAVHSLKDLPVRVGPRTRLAAVLERADPADVLVARGHRPFDALPQGAVVGTSSLRRRAQILARRHDLRVVEIRGSVVRRLDQLSDTGSSLDAIVLARAGLCRLDRADLVTEVLSPWEWLPAPGQAAIAIEVRASDKLAHACISQLDHAPTRVGVTAEREVLAALGGGCHAPVGALAHRRSDGAWALAAAALGINGHPHIRAEFAASWTSEADAVRGGRLMATLLADRGARELVPTPTGAMPPEHLWAEESGHADA